MTDTNNPRGRRRVRNSITTKSGNTIKLNRNFGDRLKAHKLVRATDKAAYLSTLPKDRLRRLFFRLHPKRVAQYWFSREGGIMALKIVGVSIVVGFFLTIGLFAYFRKDLPKIKDIAGDNLGGSITYYDRTGKTVLWQDYDAVKRIPVEKDEISTFLKQATVATEDKDFYKHGAFDVRGIMRAGFHDVFGGGGSVQGGSTITQQLVKLNQDWTDNRTVSRKVKELILAVELEREYSKDDILTGYLNIAPYGGVEYGAESAARDYFHTDAKNLTLPQAAMLAAIPKSPSVYSPYSGTRFNQSAGDTFNEKALLGRQHYILDQMVKQGMISKSQAEAAKQVDVLALVHPLENKYQGIRAPYFVLAAKQELQQKFGANIVQRGGWKVITTLDMNLQNSAEKIVADNVSNVVRRTAGLADEQATLAEDVQTGQIVALVGGVDFNNADHGKINYAAQSLIPPGSSFKPYDYAVFINNNNNVGAGSVLYDSQTAANVLPGYPCTNKERPPPKGNGNCLQDYDFLNPGPIPLRYALGGSRNIPAVKAMLSAVPNDTSSEKVASVNKVISTASAMMANTYLQSKHLSAYNCYRPGVDVNNAKPSDVTQCHGASAIGDGAFLHLDDHVNGLSTLARLGSAIPRTYILKIVDAASKNLYEYKQPKGKQVLKPDAAYIVNHMASDPNASYLPGSCTATTCTSLARGGYKFQRDNGWTFAVKTGTTNNGFDGLMTSWSTKYAVVSWVGNHTRNVDISSRTGTAMEYLTAPLTRGMMEAAHANVKPVDWTKPSGVKTEPAFVLRKHIHFGDIEPSPSMDLYPSWYVGGKGSGSTSSQTNDKVSGKVATSCTPALAKDTQSNANASTWNVDIFNGGKAHIGGSSSSSSNAPQATDDVHNCNDSPPSVTLTAPANCDAGAGGCTITVTASQGTHALSGGTYNTSPAGTISVTLGGQAIGSTSIPTDSGVYTYSFTYVPTSSGSGTLTATVVDSVLYSGSDSATITYSVPAPSTLVINSAKHNGSNAKFTWSNNNGVVTIYRVSDNVSLCSGGSPGDANCSTSILNAPVGTAVYAKDTSGGTSSQATVGP